jgi:hypothetical protein
VQCLLNVYTVSKQCLGWGWGCPEVKKIISAGIKVVSNQLNSSHLVHSSQTRTHTNTHTHCTSLLLFLGLMPTGAVNPPLLESFQYCVSYVTKGSTWALFSTKNTLHPLDAVTAVQPWRWLWLIPHLRYIKSSSYSRSHIRVCNGAIRLVPPYPHGSNIDRETVILGHTVYCNAELNYYYYLTILNCSTTQHLITVRSGLRAFGSRQSCQSRQQPGLSILYMHINLCRPL